MTAQACEKYQSMMDAAFTGELDRTKLTEFEAHVESCPECLPQWGEYQLVRKAVDTWRNSGGPSQLAEARILKAAGDKIRQEQATAVGRGWRVLLSQPVVAAATVALIIGVGIYSQFVIKRDAPTVMESQTSAPAKGEDVIRDAGPVPPEAEEAPPAERKRSLPAPMAAPPSPRQDLAAPAARKPEPAPQSESMDLETAREPPAGAGEASPQKMKYQPSPTHEGLQRAAPAEMKSLSKAPPPLHEQLVRAAEKKMKDGDYKGALEDLLKAQEIEDSEEIRRLIEECRAEIRLIKENE